MALLPSAKLTLKLGQLVPKEAPRVPSDPCRCFCRAERRFCRKAAVMVMAIQASMGAAVAWRFAPAKAAGADSGSV